MIGELDFLDIAANVCNTYDGDLRDYFRVIWNAPNVALPFHGIRHMFHVTWDSYNGVMYYIKMNPNSISRIELRNLLIAGMFHDYAHSGGDAPTDKYNIKQAKKGLATFILPQDKPYYDTIISYIDATEYPHNKNQELSFPAAILRDADMSYTLGSAWLQTVGYGLPYELNKKSEDIIKTQEDFLKGLTFETEWAEKKYRPIIEKRLKQIPILVDFAYGK